jgi:hypothetical protein
VVMYVPPHHSACGNSFRTGGMCTHSDQPCAAVGLSLRWFGEEVMDVLSHHLGIETQCGDGSNRQATSTFALQRDLEVISAQRTHRHFNHLQ